MAADDLWNEYEGIDPVTAAMAVGNRLREQLHNVESSTEARAHVFELAERDLHAIALSEVFSFRQQQLNPDAYAEWQR